MIVALLWHLPKVDENTNGAIVQRAQERIGIHHTQTKRKLIIDTHPQPLLNFSIMAQTQSRLPLQELQVSQNQTVDLNADSVVSY